MNPILYLLMRSDLESMNPGKLAAQASHVGHSFTKRISSINERTSLGKMYKQWVNMTDQGFGTAICLSVNKLEIKTINVVFKDNKDFIMGKVYDPTYPCEISHELAEYLKEQKLEGSSVVVNDKAILLRNELVGMYVFGDKKDLEWLKGYQLYP